MTSRRIMLWIGAGLSGVPLFVTLASGSSVLPVVGSLAICMLWLTVLLGALMKDRDYGGVAIVAFVGVLSCASFRAAANWVFVSRVSMCVGDYAAVLLSEGHGDDLPSRCIPIILKGNRKMSGTMLVRLDVGRRVFLAHSSVDRPKEFREGALCFRKIEVDWYLAQPCSK